MPPRAHDRPPARGGGALRGARAGSSPPPRSRTTRRGSQDLGREMSRLDPIVAAYRTWAGCSDQLAAATEMTEDPDEEVRAMARDEVAEVEARLATVDDELRLLLVPRDPNDDRNVIVEVRAGAGGDEAALFAADLFRMYVRYAERRRWKTEVLATSESDGGGLKEVIAEIRGDARVLAPQVRVRRAPRAARAVDRGGGPHPHLDRHRERAARGRGGRARRSTRRTCGSTSTAPAAPAARASTPPTRRCASPTCRPAPWSPSRTRRASTRTRPRRMTVLRARLLEVERSAWRTSAATSAARRSAAAIGRRRSGPTTSPTTGSPTTASGSPCTTCPGCWRATWTASSSHWRGATARTGSASSGRRGVDMT